MWLSKVVNGYKLKYKTFFLNKSKRKSLLGFFFSTVRMLKHCHRLPREAVQPLSLEIFKPQLGMALSKASVGDTALSRGLDLTISRDAFQPQLLHESK